MVPTHRISRAAITARMAPDALAAAQALAASFAECVPLDGDAVVFGSARKAVCARYDSPWTRAGVVLAAVLGGGFVAGSKAFRCPACDARHDHDAGVSEAYDLVTCGPECLGLRPHHWRRIAALLPADRAFALCEVAS